MKYLYSLFLFIFSLAVGLSQTEFVFGANHLLFYDEKSKGPVLLINDTILYQGKDFKVKSITNGLNSNGFLDDPPYILSIDDKTYFVANGAGPVMVLEDGKFFRNDATYEHRNQHYATPFVYKDNIYLFGGYGLFTHKNIITRYHKNTGGWSQVQTFGDELPSPRFRALSFTTDSLLYIFGGLEQDPERFRKHRIVADGVMWKFDMNNTQWSKEGVYKLELIGEKGYVRFQTSDKLYLLDDYIYELDINNNSFTTYAFREWKDVKRIIYDSDKNKVTYTYRPNKTSDTYYIKSESLELFIGEKMSEEKFFNKSSNALYIGFGVFSFVIILGFSTAVYKRHKSKDRTAKIIYNKKHRAFYYMRKIVSNLDENEFLLLEYLVQQNHTFTPLNKLNELLQMEETESFSAISKRRETTMANLLFKLSTLLHVPKETILEEQRNPNDRRLKEVKLNQELFELR